MQVEVRKAVDSIAAKERISAVGDLEADLSSVLLELDQVPDRREAAATPFEDTRPWKL